jgi:GxxExxY protein
MSDEITDPFSPAALRIESPLSLTEEQAMHAVIGSAITVRRTLGPGFLESIYRQAICLEFDARRMTYERERRVRVTYRGVPLSAQRLDLLVNELVVVELKAVSRIEDIHRAQLISYLRTTGLRAGLIINFRVRLLKGGIHRIVLSQPGRPA